MRGEMEKGKKRERRIKSRTEKRIERRDRNECQ